ncbi:uncharacterized protein LOC120267311 [Dioscorea cayenensis subsp. rotundata]|uniref:Uncharacterized protein LOC120267311 n=1 Tax=Dioscorea cayennensis subsp. rotundata TaxID=55577 RepID=A0AB40BWY3_DIOCR|nr:uncharacterized protein LOC120267311 [Dioscorea cayenensis subsp. rotundata]
MARITKSNKEVSVLIRSGHAVSDHGGSSGFNTKGNSIGLSIDDKEDEESEETEDVDEEEIDLEDTLIGSLIDEDELVSRKPKCPEFNEECDMKNPQFRIGMKFRDFKQFKEVVKNYGIKNRYVMAFKPNSKKRCKAICKRGCPFYLWASSTMKDGSTIQIKSGKLEHECSKDQHNRHVNVDWIARNYLEQFRVDPSWKISGIIQVVKTNQEVQISRLKAYRAKSITLRCDEGKFQCMYVYLAPLREGFLAGCKQIISVDGCFLKGLYGGQLISVVGIDANDCIYPVT